MSVNPDQLGLEVDPPINVYVMGPGGVLLDIIENVDLGDPLEARRHGRTSLKEACLWGYVAAVKYRERHPDQT
jgi:hypothetical protein